MNKYTNKADFTESADSILDNCDLLIRTDCLVVDDIVYERLVYTNDPDSLHRYRFFFNSDDYDYVEDAECIAKLDRLFAA